MVLSFALCGTLAFAQTSHTVRTSAIVPEQRVAVSELNKQMPVDYKSSIFTKNDYDTLAFYSFSAACFSDSVQQGGLTSTDVLDGVAVGAARNGVTSDWVRWRRYDSLTFLNYATDYPTTSRYTGRAFIWNRVGAYANLADYGPYNNGFLFFGVNGNESDTVNYWFSLPEVTRTLTTPNGNMVFVAFCQAYLKFYDRDYIDYKIDGQWYSREINVTGIDVEVNDQAARVVRYVMPNALATATTFQVRFRFFSNFRGNWHGYAWAIDNVAIGHNRDTYSWSFNHSSPYDGFYGTMPKDMPIPMTYGVHVRNTNFNSITGAQLEITAATEAQAAAGNWTSVATGNVRNIPTGDVSHDYKLWINERGFMDTADSIPFDAYGHYWMANFENYGRYGLTGDYQGRSLPVNTPGKNFYAITANNTNNELDAAELDTVAYYVSSFYTDDDNTGKVEGYRWAHDNSAFSSGYAWQLAWVTYTSTQHTFTENDTVHSTMGGYQVHVRYTTGSEVPSSNGEPWVVRGLEIVPSSIYPGLTAEIIPFVGYEYYYEEDGTSYVSPRSISVGLDNQSFTIGANDITFPQGTGYVAPGQEYNAINITFPEPLTLEPNKAYRFGYQLAADGFFQPATTGSYYMNTDTSSESYRNTPELADYANQYGPKNRLDIWVYDPAVEASLICGDNVDYWPIIRPIVGPRPEINYANVTVDCSTNDGDLGIYGQFNNDSVCNNAVQVAEGATKILYIVPMGDYTVIDQVMMNGTPYTTVLDGDDDEEEVNFNALYYRANYVLNDEGQRVMYQPYYYIYLRNLDVNADYTVSATFHRGEWDYSGIDPVAPEVAMTLAPNPATSTVAIHMSGVNGMVNCNIIDMSGRVIYNADMNAEAENTINVSNLPAGAYFVRITNNTFSKIEKLIIK